MRAVHALLLSIAVAPGCASAPSTSAGAPSTSAQMTAATAPSTQPAAEDASDAAPAASVVASAAPPAGPAPPAPTDASKPRIGSIRDITWIFQKPDRTSRKIGQVREGTSVAMKSTDPVVGGGCSSGFRAVEPDGYVCPDSTTTLDLDTPLFRALAVPKPERDAVLPYHYALSGGAPMYTKVPTEAEQLKVEGPKDKRPKIEKLGRWASGHEELASDEAGGIAATSAMPDFLKDGQKAPVAWGKELRLVRKWIPNGSMLAFTHAFEAEGRVWLLSTDLAVVPADRVRPFRTSTFHGTDLGKGVALPLAWARHDAAKRYVREEGVFVAKGAALPPKTFIALTGERVELDKKRVFLETREQGVFVDLAEVALMEKRDKLPIGVQDGERWIDVHIRAGTLVAYEGEKPVWATLVSPGAGGVAPSFHASDAELVKFSTTPLGLYRVGWKTRAAAMSPETGEPKKFWIADVPDTQYFRGPFAIHTTYWHEDFGMPKSAGCINVSPSDGRFLFGFTEPRVPEGWQGATPSKATGGGTMVAISP